MTTTTAFHGQLFLHSETGTEGGHWAFQDSAFITPPETFSSTKHCARCGRYWEKPFDTPEPAPSFTYYRAERIEDGRVYSDGYFSSDVPVPDGRTWFRGEEPGSFNDEWTKRTNAQSQECFDNGHEWRWNEPRESWSYEGLNYLENGDVIEVLDRADNETVIDTITVKLISNGDQYREGAMHADGLIIHTYPDPETIDFEQWKQYFSQGYKARITRNTGR